MARHALLSASSSKQWLNCTPSARLQEPFPNETSVYAEEGTAAHELCEYKVKKYLHRRVKRPESEYLTEEVDQLTDVYAEFVITTIEELKERDPNPLVLVEERLDYSHVAPSGFGTGDMVIIGAGELHIVDFKTGKGVFVEADHNPQMMLYALGALRAYDYLYDVKDVSMTIVQPRLENISTYTCTADELRAWGEEYVKPRAKLAFEGKGEQKPGDWCRFCRAKPVCRACAEEALALASDEFLDNDEGVLSDDNFSGDGNSLRDGNPPCDENLPCGRKATDSGKNARAGMASTESTASIVSAENEEETDATAPYSPDTETAVFKQPGLLRKEDIERILPTLNRISGWIDSVFAYASNEAINHGVHWNGYKVVEGRSRRQFTDTKEVVNAAALEGYTDVYKQELISLTEFEKMMGKKNFQKILGKYVVKPPGKLALVPDSDPRPEVDLDSAADDEFAALD